MGCDYTRRVYACVKSGDVCWLVPMPYKRDQYSTMIGEEAHAYSYGKRCSYAPYEIFAKEPPRAPENSTLLSVPKNGYLLSELMDAQSMAWFPVFIDETIKYFFKCKGEPEATELLLREEMVADLPKEYQKTSGQTYDIVQVVTGAPALPTYRYTIKYPRELDAFEPWFIELLDKLGITPADVKDIPILPVKDSGARATCDKIMDKRLEKAYIKLTATKIAEMMDTRWGVRTWLVNRISSNIDKIIELAGNGELADIMQVTVSGTPVLDENGNQKTERMDHYPYKMRPVTQQASPDDAREEPNPHKRFSQQVFWASAPTSGKPPVVWRIRPTTPEHYAMLTGTKVEDLPEILRLSGLFTKFQNAYKNQLPRSIMDEWTAKGYSEKTRSAYVPCMAPINICMTKKAHHAFPHFKPSKSKEEKS